LADIAGMLLALLIGPYAILRHQQIDPVRFLNWALSIPFLMTVYLLSDLYPGVSVSPVDELRQIALANAKVLLSIGLMLFLAGQGNVASQWLCLAGVVPLTVCVVAMRSIARSLGSKTRWWGFPVAVFGSGPSARTVLKTLIAQPRLGFRPVAVITHEDVNRFEGIPAFPCNALDRSLPRSLKHGIIAAPELSHSEFSHVLTEASNLLPHLILIPDTDFISKTGSCSRDLMGILGIHVRNNLINFGSRVAKRLIDIALASFLLIALFPLMAIIVLLVMAESGLPVFYAQDRIGFGGRYFRIWKFRTMARNADEILEAHLDKDPALRQEWLENQKLRRDPRLTLIGRVLRKTSLDELPQLWNVLRGQMSLVGPRPIVTAEVKKYSDTYDLYTNAKPGITGLWQVSGRNNTSYVERVAFDSFYIRNWSVWLDIYLLFRTVKVVLTGHGAY
jgi:Undecaprenyl-phosphate galactose phosphotransferase WbaP